MTHRNRIVPKILWLILGFVLLRIFCSWLFGGRWELFAQPEIAAALLQDQQLPVATTPPVPTEVERSTEPVTQFSAALVMPEVPEQGYSFDTTDAAFVEINYSAKRTPDIEALLTQPLQWDLTSEEPSVLIFHTHGTEAFEPTAGFTYQEEGGEYRTTDERCNMLSLGEELVRLLNEAGIYAVHDRTYYDYPDYPSSYDSARKGLQEQLEKYPTVKLVIDLHRDSAQREDGSQWSADTTVNGEKSAQIMMVMGTDTYYDHPDWEQNLSIAVKLQSIMEKTHDGFMRPLDLRRQRFNQDLSPGAIIVEVGAAGNTHREATNGIAVLAEAIIMLAKGSS